MHATSATHVRGANVNGHFREKFGGSTKVTKPDCLASPTNVSYQCILLRCMAQAHANGWRIEYE